MSIHDLGNKIKGRGNIDGIVLFFIIILAMLSVFGLNRLSVYAKIAESDSTIIFTHIPGEIESSSLSSQAFSQEKKYVASKNGKLYYGAGCSRAKRIKPANQVWFDSATDAQKLGYTLATSCK